MSHIPRFSIRSCGRRMGYEITDVISYLSLEQCTNLFHDISFLSIWFKQMFLTWLSNMSLVADFHATMTRGPKIINRDKTNHRKSPKQFWCKCSSVQYISQSNCKLNILVWFPTLSVTLGWILMPSFPLAVFSDPLSLPLFLDIVFFIIITWRAISACLPRASCSSSCLHAHQWCPLSDDQTKAHAKKTT